MGSRLSQPAYVVGSGPNGFTAAIELARAGLKVTLIEAETTLGGGARSAELTLPGYIHDVCSAAHPMGVSSPSFANFPLHQYGLEWIQPPAPLAHPFDDGSAALLHRSVEATARQLGVDESTYRRILEPFVARWKQLCPDLLAPIGLPSNPFLYAAFGSLAVWPATIAAKTAFRNAQSRALFGGIAAHSVLPLESAGSAAFGWVLAIAGHAAGWPVARGGSQSITNALCNYFRALGGKIVSGTRVRSLGELDGGGLVLLDVTPRQLLQLAGDRLPARYAGQLQRFRYAPGVFKLDWALDGPIPWTSSECSRAGTVHVGGLLDEIAASERACWEGRHSERPFVLVTQPSLFDSTRAPAGRHTAWAYCHVPNASREDMTDRIEAQIERFATGFRERILGRSKMDSAALERGNANLVGGDIGGGAANLRQLFLRPTQSLYRTPIKGVYLCSSSTPPGGGVPRHVRISCRSHSPERFRMEGNGTDMNCQGAKDVTAKWNFAHRVAFRFAFLYLGLYNVVVLTNTSQSIMPGLSHVMAAYGKLWHTIVPWVGQNILRLETPITYFLTGSGDGISEWVTVLCYLAIALVGTVVWSILDSRRPNYRFLHEWLRVWVRYSLAFTMVLYGIIKVIKLQFPDPSLARLVEPLGEFSPMGLLWTFMGASVG